MHEAAKAACEVVEAQAAGSGRLVVAHYPYPTPTATPTPTLTPTPTPTPTPTLTPTPKGRLVVAQLVTELVVGVLLLPLLPTVVMAEVKHQIEPSH